MDCTSPEEMTSLVEMHASDLYTKTPATENTGMPTI